MSSDAVTVVAAGHTRLYVTNGHGLAELAAVAREFAPADAARLTASLLAFIDEAALDAPIAVRARALPSTKPKAPRTKTGRAQPGSRGASAEAMVQWLGEHGPATRADLFATGLWVNRQAVNNRLYSLREARRISEDAGGRITLRATS